jgi:hypothetical protein
MMSGSAPEKKRKARERPAPYAQKPGPKGPRQQASSSTTSTTKSRDHLTAQQWITVFKFIDEHPKLSQNEVVIYFQTRANQPLQFTQGALSKRLKDQPALEAHVQANPSGLLSKRARVVTRPDVEQALLLWVRSMEVKKEVVTGPMLMEKRKWFEKSFDVPEKECLLGPGWVPSFCKTYVSSAFYE